MRLRDCRQGVILRHGGGSRTNRYLLDSRVRGKERGSAITALSRDLIVNEHRETVYLSYHTSQISSKILILVIR